jgi:hypothetical protein
MNQNKILIKPDEYGYEHGRGDTSVPAKERNAFPQMGKKISKRFSGKITERKLERGHSKHY